MKDQLLNDIKVPFKQWYQIIVNLYICEHNLNLVLKGIDGVRYQKVHGSGFFSQHYRMLAFYGFILELSKLFGENRKFDQVSMLLLLQDISEGSFDGQLPANQIKEVKNLAVDFLAKIKTHSGTFTKIKNYRNKSVAHTDIEFIDDPVKFGSLSELISLSAEIYNG